MNCKVTLGTLHSLSRVKKFLKGEALPCDGPERQMYVVLKGEAAAFPLGAADGAEPAALYGPGEFFGERVLFLAQPSPFRYVARTDTLTVQLSQAALPAFLREEPELAVDLMRAFCAQAESLSPTQGLPEAAELSAPQAVAPVPAQSPAPEPAPASVSARPAAPAPLPVPTGPAPVLSLFPAGHGRYALPLQAEDRVLLMEKRYVCPLCGHDFKSLKVKQSKLSVSGMDEDGRIHYKDVEPLYFDVVTCPSCLFSSLEVTFSKPDRLQKPLRQDLAELRPEGLRFGLELNTDSVFAGYYLALFCAPKSFFRPSFAQARLLLNLSRVYADCGDAAMERQSADRALEAYLYTYQNTNVSAEQLPHLCMVIGSLYAARKEYNEAKKFFFEAKTAPYCPPNVKRQAEDRLYDLRMAAEQG